MLILKEESTRVTKNGLKQRGYASILCHIGSKTGYIAGKPYDIERLEGKSQFSVTIEEEKKVPLYKQSMQLQMGRTPKRTTVERKNYVAKVLDGKEVTAPLPVWKIIR